MGSRLKSEQALRVGSLSAPRGLTASKMLCSNEWKVAHCSHVVIHYLIFNESF